MDKRIKFNSSNRELGIELLRLVSMFMVVLLHVLSGSGGGGVLRCSEPFSQNWFAAWGCETVALQAVNVFGIISGFVQYGQKWSLKKYIHFWVTVFFMNILVFGGTNLCGWHQYSVFEMVHFSIPWCSELWYVKAYLGLLLVAPVLDMVIEKYWNVKSLYVVLCLIMLVPLIYKVDYFVIQRGSSMLWLAVLYIIGGILKRYMDKHEPPSVLILILGEVISSVIVFTSKVLPEYIAFIDTQVYTEYGQWFVYTSPFVLLQAVCTFLLFSRIKKSAPRCFILISQAVFGVFVVHKNPVINSRFICNISNHYVDYGTEMMLLKVAGKTLSVYFASLLVSVFLTYISKLICSRMDKAINAVVKCLYKDNRL